MNKNKILNIFIHPINNRQKTLVCVQVCEPIIQLDNLISRIRSQLKIEGNFALISCQKSGQQAPSGTTNIFDFLQTNNDLYLSSQDQQKGLYGGKGGFGALMRGQAGTKRKITNWDASRDLQGRRIRNLNNQQRLTDYIRNRKREEKKLQKEIEEWKQVETERKATQREVKLDIGYKQKVESAGKKVQESVYQGSRTASLSVSTLSDDENEAQRNQKRIDKLRQVKEALKTRKTQKNVEEIKEQNQQSLTESRKEEENKEPLGLEIMITSKKEKKRIQKEKLKAIQAEIQQIKAQPKKEFEAVDLDEIKDLDQLKALGNENLKFQLERLGLKSGGTLEQKAERLYKIKLNPLNVFIPAYQAKKSISTNL